MLALLLALATLPTTNFTVKTVKGLSAAFAGVPVVKGSWFMYYDPIWKRGHYDSNWNNQKIESGPGGETVMKFQSGDGLAYGSQSFVPTDRGFRMDLEFFWSGSIATKVDIGAASLWAEPLRRGSLLIDGVAPPRPLAQQSYAGGSLDERLYGKPGSEFVFGTPFGTLTAKCSGAKLFLYDARGMNQPWVDGKDTWLLGANGVVVRPGERTRLSVDWSFEPAAVAPANSMTRTLPVLPASKIVMPPPPAFHLIPKPKEAKIDTSKSLVLGSDLSIDLPASLAEFQDEFVHYVKLLWDVGPVRGTGSSNRIFTRVQDSELPEEGYELWINPKTAIIRGEDSAGLRHALRTLAQLLFVKDGKLCLPVAHIRDWPSSKWRGVHLFVGPDAPAFQERLWENVLAPLKFNKVVVECERAEWDSQPHLKNQLGSISKPALRQLFDFYRSIGVEPIPLIQSFGHMQWLFAEGNNLDLAAYPETPYRIDPSNPAARKAISKIWDEAVTLLKPKTVHFGLDEVDSRSFAEDPATITALWRDYLPYLGELARRLGVQMMLWGDMALAQGEAADAAHASSLADARSRREAIPAGSMIGDWHYKNDPTPDRFLNSIRLWKESGHQPIATTWFNAANIANFYKAAVAEGAGTLQTTWVGYESNEASMLAEFRQFSAMVIAADYAWSGRQDSPQRLDYVAAERFAQMYYGLRSPLQSKAGWTMGSGSIQRIGDVRFSLFAPTSLYSVLAPDGRAGAMQVTLEPAEPLKASSIALALSASVRCVEDEKLGSVVVELSDGTQVTAPIHYGRNVRAGSDPSAIILGHRAGPLCGWVLPLADHPVTVKRITVSQSSTYAGLKVYGISGWE